MKNFDFPHINDSPVEFDRDGGPGYIVCDDCGYEGYQNGDDDEGHECVAADNDYGKIEDAGEEAADSPMAKESWED